jgi:phosphoribosylamine--glycine ligase
MPPKPPTPYPRAPPAALQAKLLEHNVRFGDPECQGLMARLESDLLEALLKACDGRLGEVQLSWAQQVALTVVMAAAGYPGAYKKGTVIRGLEGVKTAKVGCRRGACWVGTGADAAAAALGAAHGGRPAPGAEVWPGATRGSWCQAGGLGWRADAVLAALALA